MHPVHFQYYFILSVVKIISRLLSNNSESPKKSCKYNNSRDLHELVISAIYRHIQFGKFHRNKLEHYIMYIIHIILYRYYI